MAKRSSRKLRKADKALAKAEKAAAKVARTVAKATAQRDRILAKEKRRKDAKDLRRSVQDKVQNKLVDAAVAVASTPRTLTPVSTPATPTVAELREAAKAKSITGYSKMTKAELIKALR